MSTNTLGLFLRHLALSEEVSRLSVASDQELLIAYDLERGQAAFTELMRRHGPMVLRTCRRVLGGGPDAEDAFQATFVLLARKATQLRREAAGPLSLGGWLHRVAYQTSVNVLSQSIRRKACERQAGAMTHPDPDPVLEATWNEVRPVLDTELNALPDDSRRLLIACYLQGKTHAEAAGELRLPQGSVSRHLERARRLLAVRLARRGITVSAVLLAVLLEDLANGAGVSATLLVHTLEAARTFNEQWCGAVSDHVARLVKGGLAQMAKSSTHFGILLAGWVGLLGAGLLACQTLKAWPDQPSGSATPTAERPAQRAEKSVRTDCFGDPLPTNALARMGTVRLFNGETGHTPSRLLAFSPDGKVLASHIDGMIVVLWDAATGKEIRRFTLNPETEKAYLYSLDFSPNGRTLITVTWDQKVYLWDTATGKLLRTLSYTDPERRSLHLGGVAFLPGGRMLAAVKFLKAGEDGEDFREISVRDVATGKEVCQLKDPKKGKAALFHTSAFSPDGKLLATAAHHNDTSIFLWDLATGQEICHLTDDAGAGKILGIRALTFSPDGKTLAAADLATISVWDVASGKPLRHLEARSHIFGSPLAFSPDGKFLVGGQEGHVWEVSSGKEIRSLGLKEALVAHFSPDGKTLAVGDRAGVISLWDAVAGKEIFPRPGHRQRIQSVIYSPDSKTLASMGEDATIRLWDVASGKELRLLGKHTGWGSGAIAYSPDGKKLASVKYAALHLWEAATGKEIRQFKNEAGYLQSVAFSPDGKLVTACTDERITLWEAPTGKEVYTLKTERGEIGSNNARLLAFSPDGRMLALPGMGNTVFLWELATGKPIGRIGGIKPLGPRGKEASVHFLAFSPDGRVLATSSSEDDIIRLWDVASGKQIGQLDGYKHCGEGKQDPQCGCLLSFSPDGRMLATAVPERNLNGRPDMAVTLWEVVSGQAIGRLTGHRNVIRTIAFSPDGKTLVSGSADLTCLVWDVTTVTGLLKPVAAGVPPSKSLSRQQLEAAWIDLANTDPARAYRAVTVLRAAPKQTISMLKARVRPVPPLADPEQPARWIADLDDESFAVRQKAQRALEELGEPAIPALRRALADRPPLEVKRRLQEILAAVEPRLGSGSRRQLGQIRAVQVLELIATPEAQQVLRSLAKGAAEVSLTCEARAALERLARRSGSVPEG